MRLAPRLSFALAVGTGLLALSRSASADVGTADKLFQEGKALMAQGRFAEACSKYEASYDADAALGALFNLADCLERDGRLASAYGRWGDAVAFASRKNDSRASYARERRETLRPKLSFVTLDIVGKLPEELHVFKGNTKLSAGAFGTALPTDPGETVIQVVRGQDEVLWETRVELQETQQRSVVIPIDEIVKTNLAVMKKRKNEETGRRGAQGAVPQGFWSTQRIAGFVVGGVGVLGAAVGFTLGGIAASKATDLDAECTNDRTQCTPQGIQIQESAFTFATASTWTLIGSGIVAAVGITVIITAPSDYAKLEERAFLTPWFDDHGGGVVAGAKF